MKSRMKDYRFWLLLGLSALAGVVPVLAKFMGLDEETTGLVSTGLAGIIARIALLMPSGKEG